MMPPDLASLVPSLDTCRRLAEAGWTAPTVCLWRYGYHDTEPSVWLRCDFLVDSARIDLHHACPAPTLSELLEALPPVRSSIRDYGLMLHPTPYGEWWIGHESATGDCEVEDAFGTSPTEVAALLWLALAESGHLATETDA